MKQLQAGYFVDEIRSLLKRKGANMELLSRIVTEFSYFTVDGCDNVSIQNPLLAVAHKIICRGIPTRASIEVSEALLIKHFKDFFKGTIKKEKFEVVLDLKVAPNIELIFFKKKSQKNNSTKNYFTKKELAY